MCIDGAFADKELVRVSGASAKLDVVMGVTETLDEVAESIISLLRRRDLSSVRALRMREIHLETLSRPSVCLMSGGCTFLARTR